jgi:glyoxylase I family protein
MARVQGIGGVFIHADDPAALAQWYTHFLGIELRYEGAIASYYTVFSFWEGDPPSLQRDTTFAIFSAQGSQRTGRDDYTINYRVDDLEAIVAHLHAGGVATGEISIQRDEVGYGKFVRLNDPEGNWIELYEPIR